MILFEFEKGTDMIIHLSRRALRSAALATLLLPAAAFLLTWVRPLIAVPSVLAAAAAFFLYVRQTGRAVRGLFGDAEDDFALPLAALLAVVLCALLWTFFSGIGGYFYQNEDHYGRNAIFHDLLNHSWPVYFDGTSYALDYYVGFWILPALVGKLFAALMGSSLLWPAANAALFVQTVWFLVLTFLLLLSVVQVQTLGKVCLSLVVFVLFSGMDVLMARYNPEAWRHQIEWWAQCYQFSSNTTCLFWVYNQAVPAWLATMLLLSAPEDVGSFALIGLAAFPFSPLPLMGLMVYFVGTALCRLAGGIRREGFACGFWALLRECFTARNLLAIAGLFPAFALYFSANAASSDAPLRFTIYASSLGLSGAVRRLLLFHVIEFACFSLVMGPRFWRSRVFWLTQISLVLAPMFKLGYNMDFSMRASIPALCALCVFAIRFLTEKKTSRRGRAAAALLGALLTIGAVTPLEEFRRGVYKVREAGTIFLTADPFGTVLHPDADTDNFICRDVGAHAFYRYLAR